MNRTLERIGFMLVGAILVSASYFVGKIEHQAEAQEAAKTFEKVRITGTLFVEERIVVGKFGKGDANLIFLSTDNTGSQISLYHNLDLITATSDSEIYMEASENEDGFPRTSLSLIENSDTKLVGSPSFGWR